MAIVAVAADNPCRVHLALQKRPVDVDLVFDLSIIKVEQLVENGEAIAIVIISEFTAEVGAP